jgi:hypothetical protein
MDLTKLSDSDLMALQSGDLTKLSDDGLNHLSGVPQNFKAAPQKPPLAPSEHKPPLDTNLTFSETAAMWADKKRRDMFGNDAVNMVSKHTGKGSELAGLVQGAADPSVGIAQLGANAIGLGDKVNPAISQQNAGYEQAREQEGRGGMDWSRLAGNIASPVNVLGARFLPKAPTSGGQAFKQGAGIGALYGAENPVNDIPQDGSYLGEKANQVAIGAGSGGVITPAMYGLSKALAPKASAEWQKLKDAGVNTTIGQRLGGILGGVEEKMTSWMPSPISEPIANARSKAIESFNTATYNKALESIGEKVNGAGHNIAKETAQKLGDAIQRGEAQLGGFKLDSNDLSNLESSVSNATNLTKQGKNAVNEMIGLVKQNISPNGTILAEGYNEVNSKLSKEIARYSGANDVYQQSVGDALKQLQSTLKDSAMKANPEAADLINRAKAGYAMYIRAEGAAKSASSNNNTGVFTPKQLMQAVRSADNSVRDRATAHGDALLQDWAQTGLKVLGDKIPNSGTINRGADLASVAAMVHNPALIPLAAAGTVGAHVAYSPKGQQALTNLATNRPEIALKLAELLRKSAPYAGIPAAYPMLNSGN